MTHPDPVADPSEPLCVLECRACNVGNDVTFRRSDSDGQVVMVMNLGGMPASLPVTVLRRNFGIADDSADARILALIERSLDYVGWLRLGDAFPREVLDGGASWEPTPTHRQRAQIRLGRALTKWLDGELPGAGIPPMDTASGLAAHSRTRQRVTQALDHAAIRLGLLERAAVVARLEALGEEFAYIEALRERLLGRVRHLCDRLTSLWAGLRAEGERKETLSRVRGLADIGSRQITCRFTDVDSRAEEIMELLADSGDQTGFIRSNRDWLYRTLLGWDPILAAWTNAGVTLDAVAWARIRQTYHFLARRYMPVEEWEGVIKDLARRKSTQAIPAMIW